MIFTVKFLPASYGDCIWIEYGNPNSIKRILIDGGRGGTTKRIKELIDDLPLEERQFELIVITHIDRDHIEGVLNLLEENRLDFGAKSLWFNGWKHLTSDPEIESFGAMQGERLTAAILKHTIPWNPEFGSGAVVIPDEGDLPIINLEGGMKLTLLSPTVNNLKVLRNTWEKEIIKAGLLPGYGEDDEVEDKNTDIEIFGFTNTDVEDLIHEEFVEDKSSANGSSISFIATFLEKSVLFTGDSFPSVIVDSLNKIEKGLIHFDLVKLSHHGSAHNTSPQLIEKLNCNKFVISTNGSIYQHPDNVTVARILKKEGNTKEILFNYKTEFNKIWDDKDLKEKYDFITHYPSDDNGISIELQ